MTSARTIVIVCLRMSVKATLPAVLLMAAGCESSSGGSTSGQGGISNGGGGQSGGANAGGANAGGGQGGAAIGAGGSQVTPASGAYFPAAAPWTRDVSTAAVDPGSAAIIAFLDQRGFGLGRIQIDSSIEVLRADKNTPRRTFTTTGDFYDPDCDHVPVPVPPGGNIEGEDGYACLGDGDCHLIVVEESEKKLYEMWRANIVGNTFEGGCMAVWDLTRVYGDKGRGEQCTSADAAGYPIAPLLFNADEVAAGEIAHAIRFILPNATIRSGEYVHPATHGTRAATGAATAPPYGVRLRLRADFPLDTLPNNGARVVARALQKYGMLLADGGNVALTSQSDRHTKAKWDGLLGARDLQTIRPSDFQVIDMGTPIPLTLDCVREN